MVFFRDEEQANAWCTANGLARRPLVTLAQLWQLSVIWYGNRLDPEPPRRTPQEMRSIFASVGLDGPFWDPEATTFR
jgi:hypothetical protein